MVPTTSQSPRRSRGKGGPHRGYPLKSIKLTFTLAEAGGATLERLASEKGLSLEGEGGSFSFTASSPTEALARLRLLAEILAPKG